MQTQEKLTVARSYIDNHYEYRRQELLASSHVTYKDSEGFTVDCYKNYYNYVYSTSELILNHIDVEPVDELAHVEVSELVAELLHMSLLPCILGLLPTGVTPETLKGLKPSIVYSLNLMSKSLKVLNKVAVAYLQYKGSEYLCEFGDLTQAEEDTAGERASVLLHKYRKLKKQHEEACLVALSHALYGLKPLETVKHYVYVITDGENCKIGYTRNPELRLKQLQVGNAKKLTLVDTISTSLDIAKTKEALAHSKLAKYKVRGEWYAVTPEQAIKGLRY